MSDHQMQGPQPIPHEVWYFIYTLVGVLAVLVAGWIIKLA